MQLGDNNIWTAPVWVFDMVVEHMAADVQMTDASFAATLWAERRPAGGEFDLRQLNAEQFRALHKVVGWLAEKYREPGPFGCNEPALFAVAGPAMADLNRCFANDPRSNMDGISTPR
jgi:hypothetical protein